MKNELPKTIGSLISLLGILKMQLQNGEMNQEEFTKQEKEILDKMDTIVQETEFNGADLLKGGKITIRVTDEMVNWMHPQIEE